MPCNGQGGYNLRCNRLASVCAGSHPHVTNIQKIQTMKKFFNSLKFLFKRQRWARLRYDANGRVLGYKLINGKPIIRMRIVKRNGEGTIDKDIPYTDVLVEWIHPSPFERRFLRRKTKFFKPVFKTPPSAVAALEAKAKAGG